MAEHPCLGNDYPRLARINVSKCDVDRERVSNIAGLCLTANLTAWLLWHELEVTVKRELHVQSKLAVLGAEALSPFLASLLSAERFWQEKNWEEEDLYPASSADENAYAYTSG